MLSRNALRFRHRNPGRGTGEDFGRTSDGSEGCLLMRFSGRRGGTCAARKVARAPLPHFHYHFLFPIAARELFDTEIRTIRTPFPEFLQITGPIITSPPLRPVGSGGFPMGPSTESPNRCCNLRRRSTVPKRCVWRPNQWSGGEAHWRCRPRKARRCRSWWITGIWRPIRVAQRHSRRVAGHVTRCLLRCGGRGRQGTLDRNRKPGQMTRADGEDAPQRQIKCPNRERPQ